MGEKAIFWVTQQFTTATTLVNINYLHSSVHQTPVYLLSSDFCWKVAHLLLALLLQNIMQVKYFCPSNIHCQNIESTQSWKSHLHDLLEAWIPRSLALVAWAAQSAWLWPQLKEQNTFLNLYLVKLNYSQASVLPGSEAAFLVPCPGSGGLRTPCVCLWVGGARKALLLWSSNVLPKKASCRYAGNMSSNLLFFLPLRFLACSPSPSAVFASGTSRGMSGWGPK